MNIGACPANPLQRCHAFHPFSLHSILLSNLLTNLKSGSEQEDAVPWLNLWNFQRTSKSHIVSWLSLFLPETSIFWQWAFFQSFSYARTLIQSGCSHISCKLKIHSLESWKAEFAKKLGSWSTIWLYIETSANARLSSTVAWVVFSPALLRSPAGMNQELNAPDIFSIQFCCCGKTGGLDASGRIPENPWCWVGRATLGQNRDRQMPVITLGLSHYASLAITSPFQGTLCQTHLSWWSPALPSQNPVQTVETIHLDFIEEMLVKNWRWCCFLLKRADGGKDNWEADHYSIASDEMCWEEKARAEECKWFKTSTPKIIMPTLTKYRTKTKCCHLVKNFNYLKGPLGIVPLFFYRFG